MSISLVIIDTDCHVLANEAVKRSTAGMTFDKVLIFSDKEEPWGGRDIIKIDKISSLKDYNRIIVRELPKHLKTDYCLIIQFDGFVLNPSEWNNLFAHYDYIGAPWPSYNHGTHNVGNGGFSLRSKRLCEAVARYDYPDMENVNEDIHICQNLRPSLEKEGLYFAHESIASHFAAESYIYRYPTFGFHNIRFLSIVYSKSSSELDFMIENLSDRVVKTHGNLILPNLAQVSKRHANALNARMIALSS